MVVMRTIIGGSFTPLNPLRGHCGPSADVRHRRDDNSRRRCRMCVGTALDDRASSRASRAPLRRAI